VLQGRFRLNLASALDMSCGMGLRTKNDSESQGKRTSETIRGAKKTRSQRAKEKASFKRRFDRLGTRMQQDEFRAGSNGTLSKGQERSVEDLK
jgi:hypothetical protein